MLFFIKGVNKPQHTSHNKKYPNNEINNFALLFTQNHHFLYSP